MIFFQFFPSVKVNSDVKSKIFSFFYLASPQKSQIVQSAKTLTIFPALLFVLVRSRLSDIEKKSALFISLF